MKAPTIRKHTQKASSRVLDTIVFVPIAAGVAAGVIEGASSLPPQMRVPAYAAGATGIGLAYDHRAGKPTTSSRGMKATDI